jgi:hypothetical protein
MSRNFGQINVSTDFFQTWIDFTNSLLAYTATDVVSVNTAGGTTTGNGFVTGYFGANVLFCSNLRGGSLSTPATLNIISNVVFTANLITIGNSTINTIANSTYIQTGNIYTAALTVGNSTANAVIAASGLSYGPVVHNSGGIFVGSNLTANFSSFAVGNSTVNSVINSTSLTTANVSANLVYAIGVGGNTIYVGNGTVNAQLNATSISLATVSVINTTGLFVGANVFVNTSYLSVGNSTVNSFVNSIAAVSGTAVQNALGFFIGANVSLNATALNIGNATVNTFANSSFIRTSNLVVSGNSGFSSNLSVGGVLTVSGDLKVNGTLSYTGVANGDYIPASNGMNLGNATNRWNLYGNLANLVGDIQANTATFAGIINCAGANFTSNVVDTGNTYTNVLSTNTSFALGMNGEVVSRALSVNTAGTSGQVVDSFVGAVYRSAKYLIQITDLNANNRYFSELAIIYDGTNALVAEYAVITTNSAMGAITTNVNAGTIQLVYTPTLANTQVRLYRNLFIV